jgi:hypothetical protein
MRRRVASVGAMKEGVFDDDAPSANFTSVGFQLELMRLYSSTIASN